MTSIPVTAVPANSRPKRINQYIGALVAVSLGGFSLGISLGWNSSAGDILRSVLKASPTEIGLVGAIVNAGACLGVLLVPWIVRVVSRTSLMCFTIPINMIGWAFICFADQQVSLLIIGRTICGLVGGIFSVVTPLYIAEIADKRIRSSLLAFFQLLITFGITYAFSVAYVLKENDSIWRYSLICALGSAPIALASFLPETPLYYIKYNDFNAATKSLKFYRGKDYQCQDELQQFTELVKIQQLGSEEGFRILKRGKVWWSMAVCHGVMIAHQFTGINTMISYALAIFNHGGSGNLSGEQLTLVVGILQLLSSLVCTLLVEHIGRRVLLTLSATFTGLFLILLGWYFNVRDTDPELWDETFGWMPPTWISLFFMAFNLGIGPLSWSMFADTFPMKIRLAGATSVAFVTWALSLVATLTFSKMAIYLGIPITMWLFGSFTWIAAIFCAISIRDNRNKSLFDLQKDFLTSFEDTPTSESSEQISGRNSFIDLSPVTPGSTRSLD